VTHLLEHWATVAASLRQAEHVLLMLDFDGTLAPIVPRPSDACIPEAAMPTLRNLQASPAVDLAIVSGRGARDVRNLAGLTDAHYFGSHGRERIRPGSAEVEAKQTGRSKIRMLCQLLDDELADVAGFQVEDKGAAAAAHFRNVDSRHWERVERAVRQAAAVGSLNVSPGKRVFDITPDDGVNKGTAALELVRELGGLPIYFGDDTTDETAFAALPAEAITVFVGPCEQNSKARFCVSGPAEVHRALDWLAAAVCD
jgi:trehalose-phosphatase